MGPSLNTLGGSELALRNASPSPIRTQTISAIDDWGFTTAGQVDIEMMIYTDVSF